MAVLRGFRSSRTHGHTQGQVREFPADHSKPHQSDADWRARRTRTARQRIAFTSLPCHAGHSAPWYLNVFAYRRTPRMIGNSACRFRLGVGGVLLREMPLPAFAIAARARAAI